jgi:hypothetical protein
MLDTIRAKISDAVGQTTSYDFELTMRLPNNRPTDGTVTISPSSGTSAETNFSVMLDDAWNLDDETELFYRLWYRTDVSDQRFQVSDDIYDYSIPENRIWTGTLPEMAVLETEIFGMTGEFTLVTNYVEVTEREIVIIPPEFDLSL